MSDRPDYLGPNYRLGAPRAPPPSRGEVWRAFARRLLWPPQPRLWAALFATAVASLGAYGLWFQATLGSRLPSRIDWRAAAALVSRDARPGDVVAIAPAWAERAREALPDALPVRPDLPLPILAFPDLASEDLTGVRRVWLLSLDGAPGAAPEVARALAARSAAVDGPQRLGALRATRFDLRAPLNPLYVFSDTLPSASVRVDDAACTPEARGGWRCPAPRPMRVAREIREVDFLPRTCIKLTPPNPGRLILDFPEVPVGRALRGHTGTAGGAGLGNAAPVRIRVKVGDEDVGEAEEPPGPAGWHLFQLDTSRLAGRRLPVSFEISSSSPGPLPLCLDAVMLP
ncbi:MAG TPA: hypothetical protein VMT17_04110 [Anaeromyxobacteraceae bacterium]|nr:hypothetical protein [Anaeromyxobacteraceae bacterium]